MTILTSSSPYPLCKVILSNLKNANGVGQKYSSQAGEYPFVCYQSHQKTPTTTTNQPTKKHREEKERKIEKKKKKKNTTGKKPARNTCFALVLNMDINPTSPTSKQGWCDVP